MSLEQRRCYPRVLYQLTQATAVAAVVACRATTAASTPANRACTSQCQEPQHSRRSLCIVRSCCLAAGLLLCPAIRWRHPVQWLTWKLWQTSQKQVGQVLYVSPNPVHAHKTCLEFSCLAVCSKTQSQQHVSVSACLAMSELVRPVLPYRHALVVSWAAAAGPH
jgi:hypothetical protein